MELQMRVSRHGNARAGRRCSMQNGAVSGSALGEASSQVEGKTNRDNPLILVGTSDVDFYLFVDHVLQAENIATHYAGSVEEIASFATKLGSDAILLDCRGRTDLAAESFTLLKQNDQTRDIPIVALIDPSDEWRYVQLLKAGADNIFVRPILPAKLIDEIRGVLRTPGRLNSGLNNGGSSGQIMRYADIEMDPTTYRVRRSGREIHLSPIEFKLLYRLLSHPEQVVTREELHSAAWRDNIHVGPRTVDVHVGRLRKALTSVGGKSLIRTVRSVGYALSVHVMGEIPEGN
jgi:two-component system phosphate regulon response regulator PhoB